MAEKVDFKASLKGQLDRNIKPDTRFNTINEIKSTTNTTADPIESQSPNNFFTINTIKKSVKKSFPVYMTEEKLNTLDQICKETGCTRTDLINQMVDYCINELNKE